MKFARILLVGLFVVSHSISSADNYGVYYSELKALKKAVSTKEMFDEDAHSGLSAIHRDVLIDKELSFFQRVVRVMFLGCDVVIVTPETMPKLYAYVDGICNKARIATPTIFVTRHKGFFNAFAQKLLASTGGILIGQKLLHDVSDDALEAVVAHEIGHIKYNHVNKIIAINIINDVIYDVVIKALREKGKLSQSKELFLYIVSWLLPAMIINKQFEKEADEFACKDNGKSNGLIELFELMLKKDQLREEEFVAIRELLEQNWSQLSLFDNTTLRLRYEIAKLGHRFGKVYKYIYYNTFYGAHPSPEARIEAAKKYLPQVA